MHLWTELTLTEKPTSYNVAPLDSSEQWSSFIFFIHSAKVQEIRRSRYFHRKCIQDLSVRDGLISSCHRKDHKSQFPTFLIKQFVLRSTLCWSWYCWSATQNSWKKHTPLRAAAFCSGCLVFPSTLQFHCVSESTATPSNSTFAANILYAIYALITNTLLCSGRVERQHHGRVISLLITAATHASHTNH